MKFTSIRTPALGVLLLAISPALEASVIHYYVDVFGPAIQTATTLAIPVNSATLAAAGSTATVQVPRFVTSFAGCCAINQLTSVDLVLNWKSAGSIDIYNFNAFNRNYLDATAASVLTITGPNAQTVAANTFTSVGAGTALPFFPTFFVNDLATVTNTGSSTSTYTSGLNAYQGNSPLNLSFGIVNGNATIFGTDSGGPGQTLAFSGSAASGGILEVIYTFGEVPLEAAPEPVTGLLTASALIGLSVFMKRRQKV